jgi:NAD(P)H-hydrate repair Nnr-like enzyme with NAD(P)H-hydrate dehydratase domain
MDPVDRDTKPMIAALAEGHPTVLDGGALDLHEHASGPIVLTPHYRELARVLDVEVDAVAAAPLDWVRRASERLNATVLLKGHTTHVAGPGISIGVSAAPTWLATAGAGDALGGILGALVATHTDLIAADDTALARLAATAALLHGLAAERASGGGPFTILDLCAALPATIADVLAGR